MVRVAIQGAAGRMGREVMLAAFGSSDVEVVGVAGRPGSSYIGQDVGELAGASRIGIAVTDSLQEAVASADVLVDFSTPDAITAAWTGTRRHRYADGIGHHGSFARTDAGDECCRRVDPRIPRSQHQRRG